MCRMSSALCEGAEWSSGLQPAFRLHAESLCPTYGNKGAEGTLHLTAPHRYNSSAVQGFFLTTRSLMYEAKPECNNDIPLTAFFKLLLLVWNILLNRFTKHSILCISLCDRKEFHLHNFIIPTWCCFLIDGVKKRTALQCKSKIVVMPSMNRERKWEMFHN